MTKAKLMPDISEQRILICAPVGKDAELASNVLQSAGLSCFVCPAFLDLLRELKNGVGVVLTVDEVLSTDACVLLEEYIGTQPPWSDLPILVLTKPQDNSPWTNKTYERFGNLTLLERPVRMTTLISAARSALRARLRQYEIRTANQRKDEFLAMLAHELRNPLAPIGAAAQLLELAYLNGEKVKRASQIIIRQVGHMSSLIDDLLDVARVTKGLIKLDKEPLDIRRLLSEAVEQVNPLIRTRSHHLALHLPPDPAMVAGDHKRLVQVIANLLHNASKYTPEGGNIVIRLQVLADQVALEISDNGIGMAPELVSRVFELFAQAKRTSDRSQGGLGLGLALVKSLVELHEGSVCAYSEGSGKGSAFFVRLPRLVSGSTEATAHAVAGQAVSHSSPPLRVMVVDDNADSAHAMSMLLDTAGYDVSVDHSAAKAMERARSTAPEVCLLDIGLPDLDGYELARRLRSMPEAAGAILIAMTGYGQEQDRKNSEAAGFNYHLVKPIDTAKLLALLAEIRVAKPGS
jgi:signal transduction histidine kinase/ActR/RegA family two-component response regulator